MPKCTQSLIIEEDERYSRLFDAMEASWEDRHDQDLPRAIFSTDLSHRLEFRCATAASWHWGDPASTHRKRELKKHAKAAIHQSNRLISRLHVLIDSSSVATSLLDAFENIIPKLVWVTPEYKNSASPRQGEDICASAVQQEMLSSILYQAHHKETTDMYQKIANLSYVQVGNKKLHWKLAEVLASFNEVRFLWLYDVAYSKL
jgi:hypothetical protein